jgi:hypothetical protein
VEEIGDRQQGGGRRERRRAARHQGQQLIERVDGRELNARPGEDLGAWHPFERRLHHPPGARVPIVHRIPEQPAVVPQQSEVHAPGIHADAGERAAGLPGASGKPVLDVAPEPEDVPVQGVVDVDRDVWKAMHLFEGQALAVQTPQHHAPALGAQVDRCEARRRGHRA